MAFTRATSRLRRLTACQENPITAIRGDDQLAKATASSANENFAMSAPLLAERRRSGGRRPLPSTTWSAFSRSASGTHRIPSASLAANAVQRLRAVSDTTWPARQISIARVCRNPASQRTAATTTPAALPVTLSQVFACRKEATERSCHHREDRGSAGVETNEGCLQMRSRTVLRCIHAALRVHISVNIFMPDIQTNPRDILRTRAYATPAGTEDIQESESAISTSIMVRQMLLSVESQNDSDIDINAFRATNTGHRKATASASQRLPLRSFSPGCTLVLAASNEYKSERQIDALGLRDVIIRQAHPGYLKYEAAICLKSSSLIEAGGRPQLMNQL